MRELEGKPIIVWDAEIKEEIGKNGVTWATHEKMGISVACAFDYQTMDYKVFMDDNIDELVTLIRSRKLVVGFNILGFDHKLIDATLKVRTLSQPGAPEIYDMYFESRYATGWEDGMPFPSGLKLDDHLEATFGREHMKTADGAQAPVFWQQKKLGRLISYNIDDVKREKKLFEHIVIGLPVKTKRYGAKKLGLPKFLRAEELPL